MSSIRRLTLDVYSKDQTWWRDRPATRGPPPPVVLFTQHTNPDQEGSLNCHLFFPPRLWVALCVGVGDRGVGFSSVVLHPAVLLYKGIDHFLHGQVGDQLVLGQRTPGDWVKMAYPLQPHMKTDSNSRDDACCCF